MQKTLNCMTRSISRIIINRRQLSNTLTLRATKIKMDHSCVPAKGVPLKVRPDPALKKIDTAEFRSVFTKELQSLIDLFAKYNYEVRIAGGAVRDILMNIKPKDIDLATTATPDQMKEMFNKEEVRMINNKGEKHGTITPRIDNKENFEVTTLRIDVVTDGRHAEVQYTTDWQLDANRRDLTINSMFLGFDGTVYDYFFGYEDLQQRRVVFVGDADTRIKEDYLRILRYFRFYGRISDIAYNHDVQTINAICKNASGLQRISGERIWGELQKIFQGKFAKEITLQMLQCGLAQYIGLPKEPNVKEFERVTSAIECFPRPHYSIIYMAGLLNSVEDAVRLHERLKLSAFERDLILFIAQNRDELDKKFTTLKDFQILCLQPFAKREFVEELLKFCGKLEMYNNLRAWKIPTFPINGNMLRERNCPSGKKMGVIMSKLKLIWADGDFQIPSEELIDVYLPKILAEFSTTPPSSPVTGQERKKKKTK